MLLSLSFFIFGVGVFGSKLSVYTDGNQYLKKFDLVAFQKKLIFYLQYGTFMLMPCKGLVFLLTCKGQNSVYQLICEPDDSADFSMYYCVSGAELIMSLVEMHFFGDNSRKASS